MKFRSIYLIGVALALCLALSALAFGQGNSDNARNRSKPGVGNSDGWIPPGQERKGQSNDSPGNGGLPSSGAMNNLLAAGGGPYLDHGNIYTITRDSCKILDSSTKSNGAWFLSVFSATMANPTNITMNKVELKPDTLSTPVFTSSGLIVVAGYAQNEIMDTGSVLGNMEGYLNGKKIGGSTLNVLKPSNLSDPKELLFEGELITGLATAGDVVYVMTKYVVDENVVNPGQNSNSIHCRIQENLYLVDASPYLKKSVPSHCRNGKCVSVRAETSLSACAGLPSRTHPWDVQNAPWGPISLFDYFGSRGSRGAELEF